MSVHCSPEFLAALELFRSGEPEPIRAYFDLIPGKRWGICFACEQPGFVQPSGILGKLTCPDCEADIAENLRSA